MSLGVKMIVKERANSEDSLGKIITKITLLYSLKGLCIKNLQTALDISEIHSRKSQIKS